MDSLYLMIRDELLLLIKNKTYREGEMIPSEEELAEFYGVSRPTVRRGIGLLVDMGYLEKRPRHGTYVCSPKIDQGFPTSLRSFDEEMQRSDRVPRTQVILSKKSRATSEIARILEIEEGASVFKLVRLRYADETPNVLVSSYVPADLFPNVAEADFARASLYAYFDSQGKPVQSAKRRLEVIKADAPLAALLDVAQGDPIYRFYTTARTGSDRVVEYSTACYRGESNAFEFTAGLTRVDNPHA